MPPRKSRDEIEILSGLLDDLLVMFAAADSSAGAAALSNQIRQTVRDLVAASKGTETGSGIDELAGRRNRPRRKAKGNRSAPSRQ